MIYINCSAKINELGEFRIHSVFCISDRDAYLITREGNWDVAELPLTKNKLKSISETQHFSIEPIIYSPLRVLDGDESAMSFLSHVSDKLRKTDTIDFNKKLFRILCELGDSA